MTSSISDAQDTLRLDTRAGLPDALRILLEQFPRTSWERHENFGDLVRFWMQRHGMFRDLLSVLRRDGEARVSGSMGDADYLPRLSRHAGLLLNELHAHHQIEDHHYFPRLMALDARVAHGFDLLEADHQEMDALLHDLAGSANEVLRGGEAARFLDRLERFELLLERHLTDEEEIVVPVILHSGFRG